MEIYELLVSLLGVELVAEIVITVAALIGVANAISAWLPSVKENKIYNFIMKILDWLSLNIGNNKNVTKETTKKK